MRDADSMDSSLPNQEGVTLYNANICGYLSAPSALAELILNNWKTLSLSQLAASHGEPVQLCLNR
jgi:hypothetical protein